MIFPTFESTEQRNSFFNTLLVKAVEATGDEKAYFLEEAFPTLIADAFDAGYIDKPSDITSYLEYEGQERIKDWVFSDSVLSEDLSDVENFIHEHGPWGPVHLTNHHREMLHRDAEQWLVQTVNQWIPQYDPSSVIESRYTP